MLVRKGRVKKYTVIAWMESVTKVVLYQALVFAETLTVVYFYHMIYIEVQRQNRCQNSPLSDLKIKAKMERKLA